VGLPAGELAHIGVRVPVEDLYFTTRQWLAQEMSLGRLVSAAEHNHKSPGLDIRRESLAESLLIGLRDVSGCESVQAGPSIASFPL
jgi:hypothetical protein